MEFHQSGGNPFGDEFARPHHQALHGKAGDKADFERPVGINRSRNTVGHYPSLIMQRGVPYHSSHELAAMQYLDLLPCVDVYWPQTKPVEYQFRDSPAVEPVIRRWTPDLRVRLRDRRNFFVEVKERPDAERPANRARWPWIEAALEMDGYHHAFLLADFIQDKPLADNLRRIQQYVAPPFDPVQIGLLQQAMNTEADVTVQDAIELLPRHGFTHDEFFSLVLYRHLYVDLTEEIDMSSKVLIPSRAPRMPKWSALSAVKV
jgi:hypothetical protein